MQVNGFNHIPITFTAPFKTPRLIYHSRSDNKLFVILNEQEHFSRWFDKFENDCFKECLRYNYDGEIMNYETIIKEDDETNNILMELHVLPSTQCRGENKKLMELDALQEGDSVICVLSTKGIWFAPNKVGCYMNINTLYKV